MTRTIFSRTGRKDTEVASPTPGSGGSEVPPVLPSIPLSAEVTRPGEASIGTLVSDASRHVSALIKAEMELAKAELTAEVKKGVTGSVFFIVALAVLVFSLFFFFFFVAQLLAIWLMEWAAFLIVFGIMLVVAGLFAFLGLRRVKKIRSPERTISSVKDTAAALRR
jgi:uncharacterized membrane protein YqjE